MTNNVNNNRLKYIDVAKGILISLIVLYHISWSKNACEQYIGDLASLVDVSLFFVLSGFFIKDDKILSGFGFIEKRIKGLYRNTVVIGIVAVLMHNFLINHGFYELNTLYYGKVMHLYSMKDIIKQILLTLLCANREVIIGPMWFANVLFLSTSYYFLLTKIAFKIFKNESLALKSRWIVLLCGMCISVTLTSLDIFTINRFSNTFTASFLLAVGQYIYQKRKLEFNDMFTTLISAILLLNIAIFTGFQFNINKFESPTYLIMIAFFGTYFVCYFAKKISNIAIVGASISYIGKNSYWIMAGHFSGYKIVAFFLNKVLKVNWGGVSELTPNVASVFAALIYFLGGMMVPLITLELIRTVKQTCLKSVKK